MLLAMAVPAMAAVEMDTSISVSGLMENDAYKLYQVLTWNQDAGEWQLAAGFDTVADYSTDLFPADDKDTTSRAQEIVKAIVDGLSQDQVNAIAAITAKATGAPSTKTTGTIGASDSGAFQYAIASATDTSTLGLYMAVITAGTPEYVYNPVFVAADFDGENTTTTIDASTATYGEGIAKRQHIDLTKTTSDANEELQTAINSYVGQEVTFDVNTTIPVFLDSYKHPYFTIYDNIETDGINLDADSIEITLGTGSTAKTYAKTASGEKLAYDNTIFTVAATGGNNGEYTVTFNETWLGNNVTAVPVHVQYKGTITNTAEFNLNEDDNVVTVTYSNGPDTEKGAMRDQTNHYTFSIGAKAVGAESDEGKTYELVKVAVDADGKPVVQKRKVSEWHTETERHPLAGATFGLFTDEQCNTPYAYGQYANTTNYPNGATFTTGADGVITFKGLAAGDYYLKEISAPGGYIKDDRIVHINIEAHYETQTVADTEENGIKVKGYTVDTLDWYKVKVNNVSVYDSTEDEYKPASEVVETQYSFNHNGPHTSTMTTTESNDSDLINTQGVELPSTGGMGTTILYVGGSILVILAAILLITKRRMNAED